MKKHSKRETTKSKRQALKVDELRAQKVELAEREAQTLVIGIDLVKDHATLEAAYDDELGVTAAFNLNLLNHLNVLLGSDFHPREWQHRVRYASLPSRIEMYLEARCDLTVHWPGGERDFAAGERIHTENSYKFTPAAVEALLASANFKSIT